MGWIVIACAAILLAPSALNGIPFLYVDTATYLAQGQEALRRVAPWLVGAEERLPSAADFFGGDGSDGGAAVVGGRSIYYGILTYASWRFGGLWPLVALQASAVAIPLAILTRALLPGRWAMPAVGSAAGIAFLTPGGIFVGLAMPDIWAAAMLLALAALAAEGLRSRAGTACAAIVCLAALFHGSHAALAVATLAAGTVAWGVMVPWRAALRPVLGGCAAAVAVAVAGSVLFSAVVTRTFGEVPITRPHMTAHLVDMGPGARHARAACAAGADYALCPYAERLPMRWTEFLFDEDPAVGVFGAAPPDVQRALGAEHWRFVGDVWRAEPVATTAGLIADGLTQIVHVETVDIPLTAKVGEDLPPFPSALAARARASLLARDPALIGMWDRVFQGTALAGAVALLVCVPIGMRSSGGVEPPRVGVIVAVIVGGVLANALICGILASPYPRFQARVVWLIPLAAVLVGIRLALRSRRMGARPAA